MAKNILYLSLIIFASCSQPSSDATRPANWYKGNLHTHSYWSDGDEFPEVIMDWYKTHGYQFLALSDHNILQKGEKWKVIPSDSIHQNAFRDYLESYGGDWVQYKTDSNQLQVKLKTLEEYRGLFEEFGKFLIIQSEEITDRFEKKPIHMNATNIREKIEPQGGNSVLEVLQNNINAVIKQRKDTKVPMIPHVNHPNFHYGVSLADLIALRGERFFEVFNGHPYVHNMGDSSHISTENMWDLINISYLENDQPLMYGLATDDSHEYHEINSKSSNAGRGWIVVKADSLSPGSLIDAMESGQFYASNGVALNQVTFADRTLSVEVKAEEGIDYALTFVGCKKEKSTPEEFKTVNGTQAQFELTDDILFVRCRVTSTKPIQNPIEEFVNEMAWTQPVR